MRHSLRSFQGVQVKLGQAVEETVIDQVKPEVVIMAMGSEPILPDFPGLDLLQVRGRKEILARAPFSKKCCRHRFRGPSPDSF